MGHELEYHWTLYVTRNKKKSSQDRSLKAWEERLKLITTFKTAEDFWHVYNNLKVPTELYGRGDYLLFREGVQPEWEDPKNAEGGSWTYRTEYPEKINEQWLHAQLALIGFSFEELMEHVCGLEMSVRSKRFRVSLWIDTTEESVALSIGNKFKEVLGTEVTMEFKKHDINPTQEPLYKI